VSVQLSRRARAVKPSATLALAARAKKLVAEGRDVAILTSGEPDFDTPAHIKEAATRALEAGFTKYTPTAGTPELKSAIIEKMRKDHGLVYTPEQVIASTGAKQSLFNLFQAVVDEGDEVVIPSPCWVSYPDMARLAGGVPVEVRCRAEDDFRLDPDALAKALTPRTRLVVLNSPSNPTGAVYTRENLAEVAAVLRPHGCFIATDDIYEKLIYGGRAFANILAVAPDLDSRTLVVNGFSKAYAMTGWRLGYACGPAEVVAAMGCVQDQSTSNPTSITQKAGVAALTGPQDAVARMRLAFGERRARMVARLRAIPGVRVNDPGGAFYAFPDLGAALNKKWKGEPVGTATRLAEILLLDFGLAVIPGEPFWGPGHLRISYAAAPEVIERGLDRLAACLASLE
jgi:aspartate aminotransferase